MIAELVLAMSLIIAQPAATPQSELAAALTDLQSVPVVDQQYVKYMTLYASPRADDEKVLYFWVNSLSSKKPIVRVSKLSQTLFRVDIRDCGWTVESWNAVAVEDPYFKGAGGAILVRGDWFIVQTSDGTRSQAYYKLLYGLGKEPKNTAEFQARWGVDLKLARKLGTETGAVIDTDDSIVALHNRILTTVRTVNGDFWQSYDTNSDADAKNAIENLNGTFVFDAQELITTLPNGLHTYMLSDAKGARVEFADPGIARDRTGHKRPTVDNPISCVRCHGAVDGLHVPVNKVEILAKSGGLAKANNKDLAKGLEALYLTDDGEAMQNAKRSYSKTIFYINGLTSKENTNKLAAMVRWYDQKVTLDQALIELGLPKERLVDAATGQILLAKNDRNGQIVSLITLGGISRSVWETNVFKKAQALLAVTK